MQPLEFFWHFPGMPRSILLSWIHVLSAGMGGIPNRGTGHDYADLHYTLAAVASEWCRVGRIS